MLNQLWDGVGINAFTKGREVMRNRREGLEHSFATRHERGITMPQRGTLVVGKESGKCVWKKGRKCVRDRGNVPRLSDGTANGQACTADSPTRRVTP
jgi:hypothetical protein